MRIAGSYLSDATSQPLDFVRLIERPRRSGVPRESGNAQLTGLGKIFCTGSSRGCTNVGRSGGVCTTDTRSDNCRYNIPDVDYDCENPDAADNARYPETQVFGRTAGSKCFEGNLTKLTSSSQTSFCFKYTCSGTGLTTSLNITVGTLNVKCTKEGLVSVSGYNGKLSCPDPLTFCNTVGKKYCPRGCLGRGTCVSGACKCNTGYTGVDCALTA